MKVTVLFFGATADAAGTRSAVLDVKDASLSSEVFDHIIVHHPELSRHKLLFSVNQKYVDGDQVLREGDELAIFTAVSGG
jgi:molybdopterin converting factor small subunit